MRLSRLVPRGSSEATHPLIFLTFDVSFKFNHGHRIHNRTDCCLPDVVFIQFNLLQGILSLKNLSFLVNFFLYKSVVIS